jgi:aarF domain-containing kinase
MSATTDSVKSKRLIKAKQLLEQYTVVDNPPALPQNVSAQVALTSSEVPDSYWSNGHLQDGDYVTRWARGVKVAEPLVRYDPVAAEKLLFRQPTKWMVRNVQIAFPFGFWAAGVGWDFLMGRSRENRRVRARQLLKAISGLGPAIIKGGQALASRPDLLPSEYLEELQKLQDDVPRFSNELAFKTVEEELGVKFEDVFELVEQVPVAAASIGQVYKARLLTNGDVVALKIQRPKCEQIIALDLYVLRWWSGVYNQLFRILNRNIDLQSIIDDFGELIYREIDYVAEAANAQRFSELYAGVTDVFVPKIYSDLTTSKVLTMEWVDGFRLTDSSSLDTFGLDSKKLIDTLVQCSLQQILENGFFHADPHAGNLLACKDGRLCYLDFGMMSYAEVSQRNGFLLAVVHIVNRDWGELVRVYQKLGFIPQGTDLRPIEIALENALPDVLNSDISELNFKNVVNKLGDIMYTYPFSLPPFYIAIIRCLGVLEGLAIQVRDCVKVRHAHSLEVHCV